MEVKERENAAKPIIVVAGATGNLGQLIVRALLHNGAAVRALIRKNSDPDSVTLLQNLGSEVIEVDYKNLPELTKACAEAACVISALSGLREVIVETQSQLLKAAVAAGIPRFIPSDYCIDYTKLTSGTNRNLDFRREFSEELNNAPLAATSILNGMFADLLTGQAPVILFKFKRVIYWGNPNQSLDFTTMADTARFTALAALDPETPRFLRVAGEVASIIQLKEIASEVTGEKFSTLRVGGLGLLNTMIKLTRTLMPATNDVFPPWQGMQYLRDMFSGQAKLQPLDNDRYHNFRWTSIKEVLANRSR